MSCACALFKKQRIYFLDELKDVKMLFSVLVSLLSRIDPMTECFSSLKKYTVLIKHSKPLFVFTSQERSALSFFLFPLQVYSSTILTLKFSQQSPFYTHTHTHITQPWFPGWTYESSDPYLLHPSLSPPVLPALAFHSTLPEIAETVCNTTATMSGYKRTISEY